jgi:hypothetical protein
MIIDDKYNQNNTLKTEPSLEGFKSVIIETYSYEYEFFSDCNFTNNNGETILIDQDIGKANIKTIINNEKIFNNTYIKSIKSHGTILTLYSEPNLKGKEIVLSDNIIYKACLSEPVKSIKIISKI